jgi:hypothetical protein
MSVRTAPIVVLAMAVTMALAGPCHAFSTDPLNRGERTRLLLEGRQVDLQALNRIQGRRDFQRQQQQFREQDRRLNKPQQLEVPFIQQNCPQSVLGNGFLNSCRR